MTFFQAEATWRGSDPVAYFRPYFSKSACTCGAISS